MLEGDFKLVQYMGYRYGRDEYEFFDLKNDPGEENDLYGQHPYAAEMQAELNRRMLAADQPYREG